MHDAHGSSFGPPVKIGLAICALCHKSGGLLLFGVHRSIKCWHCGSIYPAELVLKNVRFSNDEHDVRRAMAEDRKHMWRDHKVWFEGGDDGKGRWRKGNDPPLDCKKKEAEPKSRP